MTELTQSRFAIIDTVDAPQKSNVVEWKPGVGYCYMTRDKYRQTFDGMNPARPTSMEAFGFSVLIREGEAVFTRVRDSIATYEDGKLRNWQGRHGDDKEFSLPLLGAVRGKSRRKR